MPFFVCFRVLQICVRSAAAWGVLLAGQWVVTCGGHQAATFNCGEYIELCNISDPPRRVPSKAMAFVETLLGGNADFMCFQWMSTLRFSALSIDVLSNILPYLRNRRKLLESFPAVRPARPSATARALAVSNALPRRRALPGPWRTGASSKASSLAFATSGPNSICQETQHARERARSSVRVDPD